MAEHSMCQPGRPLPHGLSQPGSFSDDCFHNIKSAGFFLCASTATRAPASCSSSLRPDSALELFLGDPSNLADRFVQREAGKIPRGAVIDLVVDVGDVADVSDMI